MPSGNGAADSSTSNLDQGGLQLAGTVMAVNHVRHVWEYMRMSNGQQNVTDYTFLPPTAQNLAKLRPAIPAGYTRADRAQVTGSKPKTIKK